MTANQILLQKKYARIITKYATAQNISNSEAMDFFYKSFTYRFMRDGISDMHCMSDEYLVEELTDETENKK